MLGADALAILREGIEPEERVAGIADVGLVFEEVVGGHELELGLVELAGLVVVEDLGVGLLELGDGGLAVLPGGGGAEEDAVPILVEEAFAVVVPDGVEGAGGAEALAVADELLDVEQGEGVVGVDLAVVVDAGGDPGLEAGVGEGGEELVVAVGLGGVDPGDGDGGLLEAGRELLEEVGGVLGDVAPEEELAVQRRERGDEALHVVEVDGGEAAGVDVGFGLAKPEVDGLVGADVEEGAGVLGGELGEHAGREGEGAGLVGGEDLAVRGLGEGLVLLPREVVVKVAEGLLLGDDGDVVGAGVGDQCGGVGGGESAAGRGEEGISSVGGGVLEVGGVEVDLVGGQGADELLLELEGGDGAAGEVVVEAAVGHGRPVADVGGVEDRGGAGGALDELLDGLGAVEKASGGVGGDNEGAGGRGDDVALRLHGGVEVGDGVGDEAGELDLEAGGVGGGDAAVVE